MFSVLQLKSKQQADAVGSSETSVNSYHITQSYIPEDSTVSGRHDDLASHMNDSIFKR
jgi:hypothetical protein